MTAELEPFCAVRAIFEPKRLDTLRPAFELYIGQEGLFKYAGFQDEGDYEGQMIFFVDDTWDDNVRGYWLPREDLEVLEVLYPYRATTTPALPGSFDPA